MSGGYCADVYCAVTLLATISVAAPAGATGRFPGARLQPIGELDDRSLGDIADGLGEFVPLGHVVELRDLGVICGDAKGAEGLPFGV